MKVLLIVPSNDNAGPVNVIKYLTKANHSHDVTFTVLCLRKKSDFIFENCQTVFVPETTSSFLVFIWALKFVKSNPFDVCHSHGFFPDIYNFLFKVIGFNCLKSISTVHNYPSLDYPMEYGKLRGFWLAKFHYFFLRKLNSIVGCSASVSRHLQINDIESRAIRNGVYSAPSNRTVTKCVNVNLRPVRLLFLGRLIKRKNFSELATIFINASSTFHNDYFLTVCGNGPEFDYYRNLLNSLQNVKFMGHVDDPSSYITDSEILVSTSLAEGFPLSVLEAILAGKKVLLSDIEPHLELKEFLGDAIECYKLNSEEDFKDKLNILVNRKIDRCSNAIFLASAARMLNEYVALYKSI